MQEPPLCPTQLPPDPLQAAGEPIQGRGAPPGRGVCASASARAGNQGSSFLRSLGPRPWERCQLLSSVAQGHRREATPGLGHAMQFLLTS